MPTLTPICEPDFGMMDNATVDSRMRQDDYQQPTGSGRIGGDIAPLMGSHKFDVVCVWPNSRYGVDFNALFRCLPATNASTVILPRLPCPLSQVVGNAMNGINIIHTQTFGASQDIQLLVIIVGTAGTGKVLPHQSDPAAVHGPCCRLQPPASK